MTSSAPRNLRCEYFANPLGIDEPRPRLSWALSGGRRGAAQSAWQVVAGASLESLARAGHALWDSGRVESSESAHVVYGGPFLCSRQRCWWKVRVWDENAEVSPWSDAAWFEMGLLDRVEWKGRWVGSPMVGGPRTTSPCPYLRTVFTVPASVVRARLYITALGLYEAYVNGQRVGDAWFAPGWTDYTKRVQYQAHDVGALLHEGRNALGAILGDGWYCGHWSHRDRQTYGDRPRLLARLEVECATGESVVVVTDRQWRTSSGPILESDLIMGESYDARLAMPGWAEPGFDDTSWSPVRLFDDPGICLCASPCPPVRRTAEVPAMSVTPHPLGWQGNEYVYDIGQNISGRVRLRMKGRRGMTVRIRHAEMLDRDGGLYTASLRTARATEYYTFGSDEVEEYEPRFTYHGFRYAGVFGFDLKESPGPDAVTGIVLHSDNRSIGDFECSDERVNRLHSNIRWSQKANVFEVPTDCPQRDERMGWTGDAQLFVSTGAYLMELAPFMTKWVRDLSDAQTKSGSLPPTAPRCPGIGDDGGPGYSEALITVSWTMYERYGDRRILERHYGAMKALVGCLEKTSASLIRPADGSGGFGDWLSPDSATPWGSNTPRPIVGTAYFYRAARLLSRIAGVLGNAPDKRTYEALADRVAAAFRERFVAPAGQVLGNTQTSCLLALANDLLDEHQQAGAVGHLVSLIEQRWWHLTTGLMGTPLLCPTLSRFGRDDVAYRLLLQDSYPSWLFMVSQGATTVWERWNSWTPENGFADVSMNSFNHPALGSVGEWLYAWVVGIRPGPDEPGFRHVIIDPHPGKGLTWARGSVDSPYGRIECGWRRAGNALEVTVVIPPNARATVHVPAASAQSVSESGGPAAQAPSVASAAYRNGRAVFDVGPGSYCFHAA